MENQTEATKTKTKNMYAQICIIQAICVIGILVAVLVMKFFFNKSFLKLQKWCEINLFEQTKITAQFDEE